MLTLPYLFTGSMQIIVQSTNIPMRFFTELVKNVLKFLWKYRRFQIDTIDLS